MPLIVKNFTTVCPGALLVAINNDPAISPTLDQIIVDVGGTISTFDFQSALSGAEDTALDGILAVWECPTETTGEPAGDNVNDTSHGFTTGDVIYLDSTDDTWKLAQANSAGTLGVAFAVVEDDDNFQPLFSGKVGGLSGLSPGEYYFVSDTTPGGLTSTNPTSPNYSNPILYATSETEGIVLPWRPSRDEDGSSGSGIDIEDDNSPVASATIINFGTNLTVTDDGAGQVTVNSTTPSNVLTQGKHTMWVQAASMIGKITGGADFSTAEVGTSQVVVPTYDFDPAVNQSVQFQIGMPKSWDEGTISVQFYWTQSTAGTGNVVWTARALALSDTNSINGTWGSAVSVTDAGGTINVQYISSESSAITVGNTPAEGDMVVIEISRNATSGTDTLGVDSKLIGVKVFYTINAPNDA